MSPLSLPGPVFPAGGASATPAGGASASAAASRAASRAASAPMPTPAQIAADAQSAIAARRAIFEPERTAPVQAPRIGILMSAEPPAGSAAAASARAQRLQLAVTQSAVKLRRCEQNLDQIRGAAFTRGQLIALTIGLALAAVVLMAAGVWLLQFGLSIDLSPDS